MNNKNSRFSIVPPQVNIERSRQEFNSTHLTTFNAGKLIPIYAQEVLPGSTFTMDTSALIRMSTPIFPVMDDAFLDTYYFWVPNRILWNHFKNLMGENDETYWVSPTKYEVPFITFDEGVKPSGVGDYIGIPPRVPCSVSSLPFRAYRLIWNEWFRDQNLQDPHLINLGDSESDLTLDDLLPVAKYHDYFTSCLPAPQKGPDVYLPIGNAPVVTSNELLEASHSFVPLYFQTTDGQTVDEAGHLALTMPNNKSKTLRAEYGVKGGGEDSVLTQAVLRPANLVADLTSSDFATINNLRTAFAIQRIYERDARSGTRFREMLKAHFGVTIPDQTVQIPEYLGGNRTPITVNQVVQQSSTNEVSPQGNVAAYSKTVGYDHSFDKSFVEHGWIIGVACVRTQHTYSQGIERQFFKKDRFDFYWPALANIGEQPVFNREIFYQGTSEDEEVFGYQEAWAEHRYKPNRLSGSFRPGAGSLDSWHYGDYYEDVPRLSDEWIRETDENINRTLAVQSSLADQFLADFYFKCTVTLPMPLYSVPGLLDHN